MGVTGRHSTMHFALLLGVCAAARRDAFDLFAEGSYGSSTPVIVRSGNNPHAKITYLTLRGLADLPVLMMEFTGLPYHATYLGREQMKEGAGIGWCYHCTISFNRSAYCCNNRAYATRARAESQSGHDVRDGTRIICRQMV